ncbi:MULTISPECIES: site-specific integrase [Streptomyces]|uniref:Tyrosine-type recombinase/integrase n=1 Tax=Streptomyces fimbriatus TaxID=68197 RepID=A0ABW0DEL6_STRFI
MPTGALGRTHSETISKPHTLRHQFITDNLANGVPLQAVQDAVSHSGPRTTQRYNRRRRQLDSHPAYALAAKLGERLQPPGDSDDA